MRDFIDDIKLMAALLAVLWAILVIDQVLFGGRLFYLGIVPREARGLIGIPLAPLLHASFRHLMANSVPFFTLGLMVLRHGRRVFVAASVAIILLGGFATWCIAPAYSVHAGASALIFGWFGFLVVSAWRVPRLATVAVALLAILWYGLGILFGLSPLQIGVSWQGHLCGLIAGGLAGFGMPQSRVLPAARLRR
jgi:membrane associated rhomboid family serine protease